MTNPKEDLTGRQYGRLTVLRQGEDYVYKNGKKRTQWVCLCSCGNVVTVEQSNLIRGNSKSCGCLNTEKRIERSTTHGDRHSRLYRIWTNMNTRCSNKNNKSYVWYGALGISVCEDWAKSYESFRDWAMSSGYTDSPDCTLDRIDPTGNYCPENCRWADYICQANNRKNTLFYTYNGETKSLAEWARVTGIKYHTLFARVNKLGWSFERAITT